MKLVWISLGGMIGAVARYLLISLLQRGHPSFPYGVLVVNVVGCLAIGWLGTLAESQRLLSPEMRTFLLIGVLGSFTTFSTFGYDTLSLHRESSFALAATNIFLHLGLGLLAVWAGSALTRVFPGTA